MSRLRSAACLLALAAGAAAGAAPPSEADWGRCAAIDAADARLACYDTLVHRAPRPAGVANTTSATAAPAPAPATAPAPAPVPFDPKNFGFTPQQTHAFDSGPQSISVRITSVGSDQNGHAVISLDNAQTWSVTENDGWLSPGEAVRIKHAALGAFILVTSSNHTYHVKRVR
jgi:hypothetical protein